MEHLLASISFPDVDPVIVRLGPIALRWYGLAYVLGLALAYSGLAVLIGRGMLRITKLALTDLITWTALGVVIGGRAGWWLVYDRESAAGVPWYEPLAVWHGGMSFHGGLFGVAVALLVWSRKTRSSFWNVADAVALVAPLGLFFGRVANFINAELVGRSTLLPWGVVFPGDTVARHPSQLYEAVLEGPVLLALLWLIRPLTKRRDGATAASFLIVYGLLRFLVEFTREPDFQIGYVAFGWVTMGQLLSVAIGCAGITILILLGTTTATGGRDALPEATAFPR